MPLPTGEWLSYNPLHGRSRSRKKPRVWIAYDADYLYFAFQCDDPEPSGIKTSVTRRDNIWQDDWVGLSLDALGTGQLSYHLLVNPSGVQLDMLNSAAGGEDTSPDWIWDSAGRLTDTRLRRRDPAAAAEHPLQRRRRRPHGHPVLAPRQPARRVGVVAGAGARHVGVRPARVAVLRSICSRAWFARSSRARPTRATRPRDSPRRGQTATADGDVGVSAKVGLTSTITLDATVNPDFSQVESDAFQVEVNQRFPIFFSEKRPFFMEGAGIFSLAGAGRRQQHAHRRPYPPHRRSDFRAPR